MEKITVYRENHTELFCAVGVKYNIFNVMAGDTYNNEGASKAYIYKHFSSLRCVLYPPI
jgi:hypothetical protein